MGTWTLDNEIGTSTSNGSAENGRFSMFVFAIGVRRGERVRRERVWRAVCPKYGCVMSACPLKNVSKPFKAFQIFQHLPPTKDYLDFDVAQCCAR
eukprot:2502109-Prymnesium_polylepis.1